MNQALPWQPTAKTSIPETVCVNYGGDLGLYAAGFSTGAEVLLEVIRSKGHSQDLLVYPLVYSLRHALELLLKHVIRAGRQLIDEPGDYPDGHRLNSLWNTCKPILKQVWPDDPAFATLEKTIINLCDLDPEGEAFRYPVGRKKHGVRSATLSEDLRYIDLGALVGDVLHAINLLDGADAGIDAYLDAKNEMLEEQYQIQQEMKAEYESEMRDYYEAD